MSFYRSKGLIPLKRHTVFKKADNSIYYEELISRKGFSSIYTNAYHLRMPTRLCSLGEMYPINIKSAAKNHKARHILTQNIVNKGDIIYDRIPLLFSEVGMRPDGCMPYDGGILDYNPCQDNKNYIRIDVLVTTLCVSVVNPLSTA